VSSEEVENTADGRIDDENLGELRDLGPAVLRDRPTPPRLQAIWNGDGETVARVAPADFLEEEQPRPGVVSFDNFYMNYQPALLTKLIKFCAGDRGLAEDAIQETFLAAYRRRDQLHELRDPAVWLYVVAKRAAMKFFTPETPREEHEGSSSVDGLDDTPIVLTDLICRVLDPEERKVIEYQYLQGRDRQWIAKRLGIKVHTVDNRRRTALNKLRSHLIQPEGDRS